MLLPYLIKAQEGLDRFELLEDRLESYALEHKNIDKDVDITLSGTIQEFAIAFSKETKINLVLDPNLNINVVANFVDTRPRDILLHLCRFYELDLTFSGSIIGLVSYEARLPIAAPHVINVTYNSYNNHLEMDLKNDTLDRVVQKISELSKKNIITTPASSNLIVNGYIGSSLFEDALEQLSKRNNLKLEQDEKGYFVLDKMTEPLATATVAQGNITSNRNNRRGGKSNNSSAREQNNDLKLSSKTGENGQKTLSIEAINVPLSAIIQEASLETGSSYFLFAEPKNEISLQLENVSFDELLEHALYGSGFSYKKENGLLLIGESTSSGLRETRVVQMQHRTVKDLLQFIPKELTEEVQVQEFIQLNSLILSGSEQGMDRFEVFLNEIDKSVPVVMIELLIIDVQDNKELNAGVEFGLGTDPTTSGGIAFPDANFVFGANTINQLLSTLAGNGIVNLGRVRPNFYASLQAVENNGLAKVRSKPRLSTLNGMEANLALGETRYYLNERTTLQGNQNPISLQDRRFEAVNADFSIRIVPIVSGDEFVTLEIEVNQSDFIGQVQNNAPPPQVNRTFNSNIRIHNQEMIVLGGLESKSVENSGRGVPFLSRVPVIKWLFSKRRKAKTQTKLLVFVKPTVIY